MEFTVIRSRRKTLAMQIREGRVEIRAPLYTTNAEIRCFIEKNRPWLERKLREAREMEQAKAAAGRLSPEDMKNLRKEAARVIPARAACWAPRVGVTYGRISIRCQKTRWGSCSSKGNLNFNCLLMLAPVEVLDYVVVHELCHRKQMNHSPAFYAEMEKVLPDYRKHRRWLRDHGPLLLAMAGED